MINNLYQNNTLRIIVINITFIFIIIGIILIAYNTGKDLKLCPEQKILYKYIPRDYTIDSNYPELISYTFKDMFENPQPYIIPLGNVNKR